MPVFNHQGFSLRYETWGDMAAATPVVLIHGFASNLEVNWVGPLWIKTLVEANYAVIAFDHRGHGKSSSSLNPDDYTPQNMASDALALLGDLKVKNAHFMGYSMGARVAAFAAIIKPDCVKSLCFGGLGMALIEGAGFWGPVHDALVADDVSTITDPRALMFRKFADQTKSDRFALGACIEGSRINLTVPQAASIRVPVLIAVGTKDDLAGSAKGLAALMQNAQFFDIEGRDHMLAVGDRTFKTRYLAFLQTQSLK
jgi:pimeloyl-ACP methyl ester carboxylesterase